METHSSNTAPKHAIIAEEENVCASPTAFGVTTEVNDFGDPPLPRARRSTDPLRTSLNNIKASGSVKSLARRFPKRSFTAVTPGQRSGLWRATDLKRTKSVDSSVNQGNIRRNSTMCTEGSASFEDTAIWDGKAILSLGTFRSSKVSLLWCSFIKKQMEVAFEAILRSSSFEHL